MDLNISIVLLLTLFTEGHSLKCYQCKGFMGFCGNTEVTCITEASICSSTALVYSIGGFKVSLQVKSCNIPQNCGNISTNFGVLRATVSMQCCDTDLCNNRDAPASSSNSPNGKKCYTCDGKSCLNTVSCLGTEVYCLAGNASSEFLSGTVKGCASKSVCDAVSRETEGVMDITCCEGNLCNSAKSITQSFLLLSWTFFSYILFH